MNPIDNSDFAWLVYCDWLADNERYTEEQEIRENITNPENNNWDYEHRFGFGVGHVGGGDVGDFSVGGGDVGGVGGGDVGGVGGVGFGGGVGGVGVGGGVVGGVVGVGFVGGGIV